MSDDKKSIDSVEEELSSIPIKEEKIKITKKKQLKQQVHIKKKVIHETKIIQVPLKREELIIKKRPLLKKENGENVWGEEETTIIPLKEEKAEIHIKPVHTENIVIRKDRKEEIDKKQVTIKKEEIEIEETDSE